MLRRLVKIATCDHDYRYEFNVFTPEHCSGARGTLDWEMFGGSKLDGAVIDKVGDDLIDYSCDAAILIGTVPRNCVPERAIQVRDVRGCLSGKRISPHSVSAVSIRSADAGSISGQLGEGSLAPGCVTNSAVSAVSSRKITAPPPGTYSFDLDKVGGTVHVDQIVSESMYLEAGLSCGSAHGSADASCFSSDCVGSQQVLSINASLLQGSISGTMLTAQSVGACSLSKPIDAGRITGQLSSNTAQIGANRTVDARSLTIRSDLYIHRALRADTLDIDGGSVKATSVHFAGDAAFKNIEVTLEFVTRNLQSASQVASNKAVCHSVQATHAHVSNIGSQVLHTDRCKSDKVSLHHLDASVLCATGLIESIDVCSRNSRCENARIFGVIDTHALSATGDGALGAFGDLSCTHLSCAKDAIMSDATAIRLKCHRLRCPGDRSRIRRLFTNCLSCGDAHISEMLAVGHVQIDSKVCALSGASDNIIRCKEVRASSTLLTTNAKAFRLRGVDAVMKTATASANSSRWRGEVVSARAGTWKSRVQIG